MQSALHPHGPAAQTIATLGWIMAWAGCAVLLVVTCLALYAVFGGRGRARLGRRGLVLAGGIGFPLVALSALLVYGLDVAARLSPGDGAAVRVRVVGERWWWRVEYLDADGGTLFATANEIRLPVGASVELLLEAKDVIHSFWVPSLAGKLDMIPGRTNRLQLAADREGVFRGQCAEYCGGAHALMALYVVAEAPERFAEWMAAQRRPAETARAPGEAVFVAAGCGACHAVRGTPADGVIGPDLTHVGGRLTIAAGSLPNNAGTLAGWIADAQHLKPQNLMPSYTGLSGVELRVLAEWLESLR